MTEPVKLHKPDFTAWFVLQGTIATMNLPSFYDSASAEALKLYKILAFEAAKTRLMSRSIHKLSYEWQYKIGELVTNPGRLRHFYLRKKEIEKRAINALSDGSISQVIILGAGLDILALGLAKQYTNINFIEIDRPESQQFKAYSLAAHNVTIPSNLELISGDLRNPLPEILASSRSHSSTAKTLWICEGLFMFMHEQDVVRIFKQIRESCTTGSTCIFTTIAPNRNDSSLARAIQNLYLKKEKCPFYWTILPDEVPNFMEKINFNITEQISCALLHKNHIGDNFNINHNIGDDIHISTM